MPTTELSTDSRALEPIGPHMPPARVLFVAALVIAAAAWAFLRLYTSPGVRECEALYRGAVTVADTVKIDLSVTPANQRAADPRTCGSYRTSGRWH